MARPVSALSAEGEKSRKKGLRAVGENVLFVIFRR
jgi:hypothetical protein